MHVSATPTPMECETHAETMEIESMRRALDGCRGRDGATTKGEALRALRAKRRLTETTTTTTTTRERDFGTVRDAIRRGEGESASTSSMPSVLFGTLSLGRRGASGEGASEWYLALRDAGENVEVRLSSADVRAHQLGRLVAVSEYVVLKGPDGEIVVEAAVVDTIEESEEGTLVCGPLEPVDGVDSDARPLGGKPGQCHRGMVEAVSPVISTGDSTFFGAVLRAVDGAEIPLIFSGEFLSRWRCVLKQSVGTLVEMRNLRKVVLFKGDATHEIRAFSASSEFYMVSISFGADKIASCACACATCSARATVSRFEGCVVDIEAERGSVKLRDDQGALVDVRFTHVPLVDSKISIIGIRVGARLVVTHAHPVWSVDEWENRVVGALGVDLRTQVVVRDVSRSSSNEAQLHALFHGDSSLAASSRTLKHIVEQSSFPYAHAVETWQKSLERKFDYTRDIRLIDASTVEYALGKSRVNDEQRKPGLLLAEVYEWGENVCVRGDVYAEFFKPTPLGGCDATASCAVPLIAALKKSAFAAWQAENQNDTDATRRGSTRNEGKVVIRSVERFDSEVESRYVVGVLKCAYKRLYLCDASGQIEVRINSDGNYPPSPSLLNKLVMFKSCELMCEGPLVGAQAATLHQSEATVRYSLSVDARDVKAFFNPRICEMVETDGTMYIAAQLAREGEEIVPPRFRSSNILCKIVAPTWTLSLDSSKRDDCKAVQVFDSSGELKSMRGIVRNTPHRPKSIVTLTFGGQNNWYSMMKPGTTYLIPIVPSSNLDLPSFTVDERFGIEAYALSDCEALNAPNSNVRNVRDILDWDGRRFARMAQMGQSWQPAPEPISFRCVVVAEEWFQSETVSEFGWESRLKVQDVETHDVVDVYCKASAFSLPIGLGIGAIVTMHHATRHLSASSLNIYVKVNPDVTFFQMHETCGATWSYLPYRSAQVTPRQTILSIFRQRMKASLGALVITRRTFAVRARVVSLSMLQVRWCCPACGCDAGSVMSVSISEPRGAKKRKMPAALAGCDVCRPPSRGADRPGIFEVEASVIIDDGTAQADCWLTGQAATALIPLRIRNSILPLVKKHGRITSRLTKSSDEERDMGAVTGGHVVRGHASNIVVGKDASLIREAVSHATSLGEMVFECRQQYKFIEDDGLPPRPSAFAFEDAVPREVRCGEYNITTTCTPILRFWSANMAPVNAKEELMIKLGNVV